LATYSPSLVLFWSSAVLFLQLFFFTSPAFGNCGSSTMGGSVFYSFFSSSFVRIFPSLRPARSHRGGVAGRILMFLSEPLYCRLIVSIHFLFFLLFKVGTPSPTLGFLLYLGFDRLHKPFPGFRTRECRQIPLLLILH